MLHTENVARGGKLRGPKCRGVEGVYDVLTFQKSRGQELNYGGQKPHLRPPPPALNEALTVTGRAWGRRRGYQWGPGLSLQLLVG